MTPAQKERRRLAQVYGSLYTRHAPPNEPHIACFYCGDLGTEIDHCPALSCIESVSLEELHKQGVPLVLIRSCQDCNRTMTNKPLFTVMDRLLYLDKKLNARYEKKLALWSEDEMAVMSPMFQKMIRSKLKQTNELLMRIRHIEWRIHHKETHPESPRS